MTPPVSGLRLDDVQSVEHFCSDLCDRAEAMHGKAPLRLVRAVAGMTFDIATTIDRQAALCAERLGTLAGSEAAGARLLIACAGELGLAAPPLLGRGIANVQALEEALEPSRFRIHHDAETRFWQVWERDRRIGVQLQAGAAILPPWEAGSPLRNLVKWALATPDCGLLHAGTLGAGGRGFLFAGQGGSGKSGTVLSGLRAGLESVGDDYVLARLGPRGVEVFPAFQTLKCDTEGMRRLGFSEETSLMQGPTNWQGKHEFTVAQMTGHPAAERLRIEGICLPVIAYAERTVIEPLSPRDAFLALAPTGIAQLPGDRAAHFTFCARLSRAVPTYRLLLGTDPFEIADAIRTAISKGCELC